jgi:hypothetical protein
MCVTIFSLKIVVYTTVQRLALISHARLHKLATININSVMIAKTIIFGMMTIPSFVISENKMLIKTMCGELKDEMAVNNMPDYRSGVRLNACIKSGSYSLPQLQAVVYESDSSCSTYSLKYYNSTVCSAGNLFLTDPPQLMDGTTCVSDKYIYQCGTIDDISVNEYSGIVQYGYEDAICGTLDYFMQYGCVTDASECINLEPFGAPDSAKVLCSAGNGTTIHYGGTFYCDSEPVISSRPEDTCVPYEEGTDDQFSQGGVFFTGTTMRQIACSDLSSKEEDDDKTFMTDAVIPLIVGCAGVAAAVFGGVILFQIGASKRSNAKPPISEIESPMGGSVF